MGRAFYIKEKKGAARMRGEGFFPHQKERE